MPLLPLFVGNSCSHLSSDYAIGGEGGGNKNSKTSGVIEDSRSHRALPLSTPGEDQLTDT